MASAPTHVRTGSSWTVSSAFSGAYRIRTGDALQEITGDGFLVLDTEIPLGVGQALIERFPNRRLVLLRGGEAMKDWATVQRLTAAMEYAGLQRRDEIIAVGGGAVLDVAGFAASIYRRGLPYVRVPTTLLAYVDASVGVKTGINVGERKNLIGAFAPPARVILDRSLLASLPDEEVSSGLGEVLKLAVGCDPSLLVLLDAARPSAEWASSSAADPLLDAAITVMLRELQPNLYEGDLCRAVDLGHTFSLPMEMAGMRHGEAVAVDVLLSAAIAFTRGFLSFRDVERVRDLMVHLRLPTAPPEWDLDALLESLEERRRHRGGDQRVPLPARLGSCVFADDVGRGDLEDALEVLA